MWCPQCGATLRENASVCDNCGAAVSADTTATSMDQFASSTGEESQPPMRAPRNGPLSPVHAPDSTTTLGGLDPAEEAEWDAAWPEIPPMPPMEPPPQIGGFEMPGMAGMAGMSGAPDITAQGRPVPPRPAQPFSTPGARIQTPRLQAPPPGDSRSPFWPDQGTGLGNNIPLDPNLPSWLFERPDQWESPPVVGGSGNSGAMPGGMGGSPAGGGGWDVPSPFADAQQTGWQQAPRAGGPTPRGIHASDHDASAAAFWDETPAVPPRQGPATQPTPPWKTLRDAIPATPSPTGEAWPDAPFVPDDQPRGLLSRFRIPERLAERLPRRGARRRTVGDAVGVSNSPRARPQMPRVAMQAPMPPSAQPAGRPSPRARPRPQVRSIRLPWSRSKGRTPTLTEQLARGSVVAHDTGRGWKVVMPTVDPSAAVNVGWMAPAPVRPNQGLALIGGLTRLTFNTLLLLIVLAVLAIPVGIGVTHLLNAPHARTITQPTPTAAPLPTPYPGYKTFNGRASGFTVDYPTTWRVSGATLNTAASGDVQGISFTGGTNIVFAVLSRPAIASSNLNAILSSGPLPITPGQQTQYNPISLPGKGPTQAGVAWQSVTYTYDISGVQMQEQALMGNYGVWTYMIIFQAPASQFAAVAGQNFIPMFNSLRPVG